MPEVKSKKFKEVGGAKKYLPWKEWEKDDFVEGEFVGTSEDNYGKTNYHIKLSDFQLPEDKGFEVGDTIGLNANGSLDYKMESVKTGQHVRITYEGKIKLPADHKFAGKDSHQCKVEVAEEDGSKASDLDRVL